MSKLLTVCAFLLATSIGAASSQEDVFLIVSDAVITMAAVEFTDGFGTKYRLTTADDGSVSSLVLWDAVQTLEFEPDCFTGVESVYVSGIRFSKPLSSVSDRLNRITVSIPFDYWSGDGDLAPRDAPDASHKMSLKVRGGEKVIKSVDLAQVDEVISECRVSRRKNQRSTETE